MPKKTLTRVAAIVMTTASMLLTTAPIARAKLGAEQACAKGRYDAAAKYTQCHAKAIGQVFATNDLAKLQPALSKCRVKFSDAYLKLQKKAVGTGSTCEATRFVDNGDGTVTDNLTDLQWEKKTDDGGIHDKDDRYSSFLVMFHFLSGQGSTFTGLNEDTGVGPLCFAAFCDWRLPTLAELQTILSEPFPCTTSPCIDPIFGPTTVTDYWSATTLADNSAYAWGVYFGTGEVSYGVKTLANSVRAVRGGL